jgi:hypothetical protein
MVDWKASLTWKIVCARTVAASSNEATTECFMIARLRDLVHSGRRFK